MDATTWIALVSLVVAVAALGISIWAVLYARRQAHAAERSNRLAEQQHHEDVAPMFTLTLREDGEHHVRLVLELVPGHVDLDSLDVEVVDDGNIDGELVEFTPDQNGVGPGQPRPRRRATFAALPRGQRATWRVQLPERNRAPRLRLRVISRSSEESWTTVVETPVPPNVLDTVF